LGVPAAKRVLIVCWAVGCQPSFAGDYFLTIGGGYDPSGNQASLEANVVFFQQLLSDQHRQARRHDIYFADGNDPAADLQILDERQTGSESPVTELLASLHRRRGELQVTYRNHRVAEIAGPLDPELIRAGLDALAKTAQSGDRLIVYVTAHGSAGPKDDPFNTTIDCWNERKIAAREFSKWLAMLPAEVPVVMVMAQCYCGGFAHAIFQDLDEAKGLAPHLRAGFFAQQHDLPAAGCRPDIEHDEEFSSYFWGALAGRSRNGVAVEGCDLDGNGVVSFAEAYAHAVIAGQTIDIPLRTSEVLLRSFSRLTAKAEAGSGDSHTESPRVESPRVESPQVESPQLESPQLASPGPEPALATMSGTLQSFVDRGPPVSAAIVRELSKKLGFTLDVEVASVTRAFNEQRRTNRFQGRGGDRRRGGGRRDLLREVREKWPELGDARHWEESPLLKPENQEQLLAELKQLPGWKNFDERRKQMETLGEQAEQQELRLVTFRRLINALETMVLEQNLPLLATPEVLQRYRQMVALEESLLAPGGG
jgi:hypothetical protein